MSKDKTIEIIEKVRRLMPFHPDYKGSPIDTEFLAAMRSIPSFYAIYGTKLKLLDDAVEEVGKSTVDADRVEEIFKTFKKLLPSPDYAATWWSYMESSNLLDRAMRELRESLKHDGKVR